MGQSGPPKAGDPEAGVICSYVDVDERYRARESLAGQAERAGVRKLIAVIGDSANAGSVGVHRAQGFRQVGVLSSCGWKFDRWLDVVLMEKALGRGDSCSPQ